MTRDLQAQPISEDLRLCFGERCAPRSWKVEQDAEGQWLLQEMEGGTVFTLAGSSPVCPRCGGELYPAGEC